MKGADEELKDKLFRSMSSRAAEIFKDDMETLGPVKLSEVETAQKEILEIIKRLSDSGDITLSTDTDGMVE
jgi:flagellar motor switch protein FliG